MEHYAKTFDMNYYQNIRSTLEKLEIRLSINLSKDSSNDNIRNNTSCST